MSEVDRMKSWARSAPLKTGEVKSGDLSDVFDLPESGSVVILAIDSNGRVFQIDRGNISNGALHQIGNGRTAVLELLDRYGVQDQPDWDAAAGQASD